MAFPHLRPIDYVLCIRVSQHELSHARGVFSLSTRTSSSLARHQLSLLEPQNNEWGAQVYMHGKNAFTMWAPSIENTGRQRNSTDILLRKSVSQRVKPLQHTSLVRIICTRLRVSTQRQFLHSNMFYLEVSKLSETSQDLHPPRKMDHKCLILSYHERIPEVS